MFIDLLESSLTGLDGDPEEEGLDVRDISSRFVRELLAARGSTRGAKAVGIQPEKIES